MSIFQRLRVLELASVLAGPATGVFFAELGATVIKVENPRTAGDVTRSWKLTSEAPDHDVSAYFSSVNWGKQSLAIDLQQPQGGELVRRLADQCDVVIANYKPGDAEKLGVDAQTLRTRNPRLIYAHLTGYGAHDARAGYDAVIQAESGFIFLNGEPAGPPLKLPVALMDLLAAHQMKEAILVALLERSITGEGATLQVSLLQSALASLANQATNWLVAGQAPVPMGSEHPNIVPYGSMYPCADGAVILLAVGNDKQFARLCQALEVPELAKDARFVTNPARVLHRQVLHPILLERFQHYQRDPLLAQLQQLGVPAGAVHNIPEALAQPEAQALLLSADGLKGLRTFACEGVPAQSLTPPPACGAHTVQILQDWLQLTDREIRQLQHSQVIA